MFKFLNSVLPLTLCTLAFLLNSPIRGDCMEVGTDAKNAPKTSIIPDTFLHKWDPITIFFAQDTGLAAGGPEDAPGRYITMWPNHPGVYSWIDTRTLQFRPVEPWPPLIRVKMKIGNDRFELPTLMSAPIQSFPKNNAKNLDPIQRIKLVFDASIAPDVLAQAIRIELRPLPGVGTAEASWLDLNNFTIKAMEKSERERDNTDIIMLNNPIAEGTLAIVHLKLSLDETLQETFYTIRFQTAPLFTITKAGSGGQYLPISATGIEYSQDQAIHGYPRNRTIQVQFSAFPQKNDFISFRNLIRITPQVQDLAYRVIDETLYVNGKFESDTIYQIGLHPTLIKDQKNRMLHLPKKSIFYVFFPSQRPFLKWHQSQGILERFGSLMMPLEGRGFDRVDIRIYPIDPLNRSLWPFPNKPVVVDENDRPFSPGEEPSPFTDPERFVSASQLAHHLKNLSSPDISELIRLPIDKEGPGNRFGLDLTPYFERLNGHQNPGTYLVGIRKLDGTTQRHWVRVQVTDLCLTTIEGEKNTQFFVTSLHFGTPVEKATVLVEGAHNKADNSEWVTLFSGQTNNNGQMSWKAPGRKNWRERFSVRRITVIKESDILVLNPIHPPQKFYNNHWANHRETWLQWTQESLTNRGADAQTIVHLFTDRPVYRPQDKVYIKGYIRKFDRGTFKAFGKKGHVIISGPGNQEWRLPTEISDLGSFNTEFEEKSAPTGAYSVYFEVNRYSYGHASFLMEPYRLPKFEILLNGPQTIGLDETAKISLTGKYYAGGLVVERPVRWRVTQFPYTWTPVKQKGYFFSTDARFSHHQKFRTNAINDQNLITDAQGASSILVDPTTEPTAQPRKYIVEATVTGKDDQTVSNTHHIFALPPFVLGLQVPRYIEDETHIQGKMMVVGPKGEMLPHKKLTLRLIHRQWHSYLKASDFSQGNAQYVSHQMDQTLQEKIVMSQIDPVEFNLPIDESGVYIVELEAEDNLGRTQVVSVDLFAGKRTPTTWSKPQSNNAVVTSDQLKYKPGETAKLVVESPFQKGQALVVLEQTHKPHIYQWIPIKNGVGTFELKIQKEHMPKLPVHFLLIRGRLDPDQKPEPHVPDLGKPQTLAVTKWVQIDPVRNRVYMDLDYPQKAQPGTEISLKINLKDEKDAPLSGEVCLWLVDQAVLALGKEKNLDPLAEFIPAKQSYISIRDTRNLAMGYIPQMELPGGDFAEKKSGMDLEDKVTVRKNFSPVPYFNPIIPISATGTTTIRINLPDNLTNFKIRAKAVSGQDRFGFAKGHIAVRLPVLLQPSLPRFLRPQDIFQAIVISRVVEGEIGQGQAKILRTDNLKIHEQATKLFSWEKDRSARIEFKMSVPQINYTNFNRNHANNALIKMAVMRNADKAKDAFQLEIPIFPDQFPVTRKRTLTLKGQSSEILKSIDVKKIRPKSLIREILISDQPGILAMTEALNFLLEYPYGCTEQRISRGRALIAYKSYQNALFGTGSNEPITQWDHHINATLDWIKECQDEQKLIAFWPGTSGNLSLTAWAGQFMMEAKAAGFAINESILNDCIQSLKNGLRSSYAHFITREKYGERVWALSTLAFHGDADDGYIAELARKAQFLTPESKSQVLIALSQSQVKEPAMIQDLLNDTWQHVVIQRYQENTIYNGLQPATLIYDPLILGSETRTIAEILRALTIVRPKNEIEKKNILTAALISLGQDNGWGTTNANAAALMALKNVLENAQVATPIEITLTSKAATQHIKLSGNHPFQLISMPTTQQIQLKPKSTKAIKPLFVREKIRYLPKGNGSLVAQNSQGFVLNRELIKVGSKGQANVKFPLDKPGKKLDFDINDLVEDHVEVINSSDRFFVAITVPLAAGMEPLNPNLKTAPQEAAPSGILTQKPDYVQFFDDQVTYYYNQLPKGVFHFYFRCKALISGKFCQPAAFGELMYDAGVRGNSNGAQINIANHQ